MAASGNKYGPQRRAGRGGRTKGDGISMIERSQEQDKPATLTSLRTEAIRASVRARRRETQQVPLLAETRRMERVTIIRELLWERLGVAPERTRPVTDGLQVEVDGDLVFGYFSRWNGERGLALVLGTCPRCGEMAWVPVRDLAGVGLALERGRAYYHQCHPLNVAEKKRERAQQPASVTEGA